MAHKTYRYLYLLLFLFLLVNGTISELSAQRGLIETVRLLYPKATNFDTKIYLYNLNTCIDLYGSNELIVDSLSEISICIETPGIKPIETTTHGLLSGIAEDWSYNFTRRDENEISRRRAFPYTRIPEYKCLSNDHPDALVNEKILGLYHQTLRDSFYMVIRPEIVAIFRKTQFGFRIRFGSYVIFDDRLETKLDKQFYWDENSDTLSEQLTDSVEYQNIELCYLLHDCIHSPSSNLNDKMISWSWIKLEPMTTLDELVQRMNTSK